MLSKKGELRRDEACLDFGGKDVSGQICTLDQTSRLYNTTLKFDKNEARKKCLQAVNTTVRIVFKTNL